MNVQRYFLHDHFICIIIRIHTLIKHLTILSKISIENTNNMHRNRLDSHCSSIQNRSYQVNSIVDSHYQTSMNDDQSSTRVLSMNIPVDNSHDESNGHVMSTSSLNIEIEQHEDEADDMDVDDGKTSECISRHQRIESTLEHVDQQERLEVFVGFYRPGDYQREAIEDDDDDTASDRSHQLDKYMKDEQVGQRRCPCYF
jgi:hypothetical protein